MLLCNPMSLCFDYEKVLGICAIRGVTFRASREEKCSELFLRPILQHGQWLFIGNYSRYTGKRGCNGQGEQYEFKKNSGIGGG